MMIGTAADWLGLPQGQQSMIKVLLTAGAAVDARCKDGETPLMRAAYNGHLPCVETLIGAGDAE
jgi:ankyrin repeat protein